MNTKTVVDILFTISKNCLLLCSWDREQNLYKGFTYDNIDSLQPSIGSFYINRTSY